MRFRHGLIAALTLTATVAATAHAGGGVGGRYAWIHHDEADEGASMWGVFGRAHSGILGFELAVDRRSEDLPAGAELVVWPVTASVLVYPVPQLYGVAGLGWYNATFEPPSLLDLDDRTETTTGFHIGGGVEVPLTPRLALTGDLRYLFIDYDFGDLPDDVDDIESNHVGANAGLMVTFP